MRPISSESARAWYEPRCKRTTWRHQRHPQGGSRRHRPAFQNEPRRRGAADHICVQRHASARALRNKCLTGSEPATPWYRPRRTRPPGGGPPVPSQDSARRQAGGPRPWRRPQEAAFELRGRRQAQCPRGHAREQAGQPERVEDGTAVQACAQQRRQRELAAQQLREQQRVGVRLV